MKKILGTPLERFTRMMFTQIITRLAQYLSENEFSISQIAALHQIDARESLSIQELSTTLNLSLSATSRLVDTLVEKKLLNRVEHSEDRRAKLISITDKGHQLLDEMSIERVSIVQEQTSKLPTQIPKAIMAAINIWGKGKS